jgi:hypothetical protein
LKESLRSKLQFTVKVKYDLFVVTLIGIINSFALSPSITNSLGITSLEDGPIQPSIVYKDPTVFTNDFHASEFQRLMWTTSTKWIPAILYKYLNIDPIFPHVFLVYAQTILMLVGTFYLATSLFKSRRTAYISVAFIIMFSPYFNNFASYGDQFFMPYGTWISIGPLLLAWANAIDNKRKKTFIWLLIGASIHPAMALCASFATLAFKNFSKIDYKIIRETLILFSPAILFSFVAVLVRRSATAQTIPEEWYLGLKQVFHWYAWKLNPTTTYFETTAYTILLIFSTYILTQSSIFNFSNTIKNGTQKLVVFFVLLYLLQAASFLLGIAELFSISFGRFSIFTSIFSIIISAFCISSLAEKNTDSIKVFLTSILIFCLMIPSFLNLAILGSILLFNNVKKKRSDQRFNLLSSIFILLCIVFGRANYNDSWWTGSIFKFIPNALHTVPNYLALKMMENISMYSWLLILLTISIYNLKKIATYKKLFIVAVIILLTTLTLGGRYVLSERRDATHRDWVETQLWALNNSPKNAKFIVNSGFDVYESWTTLSRRPRLIADLSAGFLYFYTKEDLVYDQKRSRLPSAPNSYSSNVKDLEFFYSSFKKEMGGDYLVWKNDAPKINLSVAYSNDSFTIYELE